MSSVSRVVDAEVGGSSGELDASRLIVATGCEVRCLTPIETSACLLLRAR
jgi:hypothetical protein